MGTGYRTMVVVSTLLPSAQRQPAQQQQAAAKLGGSSGGAAVERPHATAARRGIRTDRSRDPRGTARKELGSLSVVVGGGVHAVHGTRKADLLRYRSP
eukprot:SAG31_NODE_1124_length_9772_cov_11.331541_2_plen_98_part_00